MENKYLKSKIFMVVFILITTFIYSCKTDEKKLVGNWIATNGELAEKQSQLQFLDDNQYVEHLDNQKTTGRFKIKDDSLFRYKDNAQDVYINKIDFLSDGSIKLTNSYISTIYKKQKNNNTK